MKVFSMFYVVVVLAVVLVLTVPVYFSNWKLYELNRYIFGCQKNNLKDVALVLVFNSPFYENIPYLKEMYNDVFGRVIFCGETSGNVNYRPDIIVNIDGGNLGYQCATKLIQLYPGYAGYLYGNDDMIINWWNLVNRDKTKIWQGPRIVDFRQTINDKFIQTDWIWWKSYMGLTACKRFYRDIIEKGKTIKAFASMYQIALSNGHGELRCGKGWADFFYIPERFSNAFVHLSEIAYKHHTFLEIAVNNILRSLDVSNNFEIMDGVFLPDLGVQTFDSYQFWSSFYTTSLTFIHPFKFKTEQKQNNMKQLRHNVISHTKFLLQHRFCKLCTVHETTINPNVTQTINQKS